MFYSCTHMETVGVKGLIAARSRLWTCGLDTGDKDDKLCVSLVDGSLQVRVRLGAGSFDAELRPPLDNVRYDDGQWHQVVISREAREVRSIRSITVLYDTIRYDSRV